MDQQEQQIIDRIKQAQNVLVTVSVNPSVDQLSAAIGLTIALNKMDKHGTAVFSGQIPDTIEFLKPEETLEKNTDSLRDFIIALDKSKADKLRYKVEDQVVRIFITPYKTSLSDKDLEFSQGDFNVDVVIALGVADQKDIDTAISAHGRILHDATVATVGVGGQSNLGTINWIDSGASSLSELMLGLIDGLDKKLLDNQIATALLTGIVASTDRFRNEKTSPKAMSVSAELMAAGANQQLIATELETPPPSLPSVEQAVRSDDQKKATGIVVTEPAKTEPGELDINHDDDESDDHKPTSDQGGPSDTYDEPPNPPEPPKPQIHVDENGTLSDMSNTPLPEISHVHGVQSGDTSSEPGMPEVRHGRVTDPPSLGDTNLTANAEPEGFEPSSEELSLPAVNAPLLRHNENVLPTNNAPMPPQTSATFIPQPPLQPAPQNWQPPQPPVPTPPPMATPTFQPFQPPLQPLSTTPLPPSPEPGVPLVPLPPPPPPFAAPSPVASPVSPASASLNPGETLSDIEKAVHSSHAQPTQSAAPVAPTSNLQDARSAVQAAFDSGDAARQEALQPIVALNAQPLGAELHPVMSPPTPTNAGFSEQTPGNTPADATLDMPLPSNPFGPGQQANPSWPTPPPSSFPAPPPQSGFQGGNPTLPPPVPPPMLPPLQ
jgi:hypothetical protein